MASFWSEYLKHKVLDHMRGIATWTPGATSFFCLMKAAPTPLGGGTEIVWPRLEANNNSTTWNAAIGGKNTNKLSFEFMTAAPADLGVIVGIAEYDAGSGGNLLTYGDLTTPKTILTGMNFTVLAEAGQFTYIDDIAP